MTATTVEIVDGALVVTKHHPNGTRDRLYAAIAEDGSLHIDLGTTVYPDRPNTFFSLTADAVGAIVKMLLIPHTFSSEEGS